MSEETFDIQDPPDDEIDPALENNPEGNNLRIAAQAWMDANPEAMALFRNYAAAMASLGRSFGIGLLAERVRWECQLTGVGGQDFKVNNNYRAYIARRLRHEMPSLRGLLRFRKTRW